MQHAYSRYKTNEMRLYNIIHLTRKHLFNITLVPMQTEHYILCLIENLGLGLGTGLS